MGASSEGQATLIRWKGEPNMLPVAGAAHCPISLWSAWAGLTNYNDYFAVAKNYYSFSFLNFVQIHLVGELKALAQGETRSNLFSRAI